MPIVTPSTSFTFLDSVNRLLTANGILRGDTDAISTFSDLQHSATVNIAKVAIQDELIDLISDTLIPYEKTTTGSIPTVNGTRSYSLPTGFIRFFGTPMLYCSADNFEMFEYRGGEDALKLAIPNYKTGPGTAFAFYFEGATSKKISFYPVPDGVKTYTFDYETSVLVTSASDTMPFHNSEEAFAFCRMASRRFIYLYEEKDLAGLRDDAERNAAKAVLADLIVGKEQPKSWAPFYR